jgi:REP element-mobilizing transposase RayT
MPSKYDPQKHHRRSIRLPNYDYAQPCAYYITIVTYQRAMLFGNIVHQEMQLNDLGKIADECWREIPDHFSDVELGAYVMMPNHVHGIIVINRTTMNSSSSVGARHASPLRVLRGVKPHSIRAIVGSFKAAVTRRIGRELNIAGIWQRNYGACPELVEGSTLSATNRISRTKRPILTPILCCGTRMMRIR